MEKYMTGFLPGDCGMHKNNRRHRITETLEVSLPENLIQDKPGPKTESLFSVTKTQGSMKVVKPGQGPTSLQVAAPNKVHLAEPTTNNTKK